VRPSNTNAIFGGIDARCGTPVSESVARLDGLCLADLLLLLLDLLLLDLATSSSSCRHGGLGGEHGPVEQGARLLSS
jgi:hypothetical protein